MAWSKDYKKSIDCGNPKGFSQKAHCAARKKRQKGEKTKSMSPFSEDVSGVKFPKFGHKTPHLKGKQHQLDPNLDLKQLVHHSTVQYVDRDADGDIDIYDKPSKKVPDENVSSFTKAAKYSDILIKKQKGEMLHTKRGVAYEESEMKYCKLCRKMESRDQCSYGPTMWDKYSVAKVHPANEAKDHEYSMARSELSTIVNGAKRLQKKMKKGEGEIEAWVQSKITKAADYIDTAADYVDSGEMNKEEVEISEGKRDGKSAKDKDYSLHDWFKGGGWVQAGGKYDGKPCAKQPGQKTKPFCRDADDRASMSKEERNKRAKKKRKEDPNPNRKGKAKFVTAEQFSQVVEEKDACYSKVKARYKVWPSAYASGALVKCRKVGAANWGNKTQKEGYEFSNWRDDFKALEIETIDLIKPEPLVNEGLGKAALISAGIYATSQLLGRGMKKFVDTHTQTKPEDYSNPTGLGAAFSKKRTELKNLKQSFEPEGESIEEKNDPCWVGYKQVGMKKKGGKMVPNCVKEGYSNWREELNEDWQKVNRQDKTDGLSQKAVDAYRRENPGSKLQTAVTEKKPTGKRAKRRANFCRRMKGMKSKLTSAKTARDPDSRINKALRRWNCN
jgi:hypothetical protein